MNRIGLIKYFNKFRRELYKTLSKLCLKQAKINYFGLELNVPIVHGLGSGFLVPGDQWMSNCLAVFLQQKKGVVVDIGVNIGLYLVKLKALEHSRNYIGFEPNPICNYYTQRLIRENDFQNVQILPFALSDKKEIRPFYIRRKADKMGSLNDYARYGEEDKFSSDLFTLPADDFFEVLQPEAICVFKIDVEGAELEVLRGLAVTIKQYRPYVFCEIWQLPASDHPTYNEKFTRLNLICELIKSLSYCVLGVSSENDADIQVLESFESFNGDYRRDYILVHESEVNDLKNKLIEL